MVRWLISIWCAIKGLGSQEASASFVMKIKGLLNRTIRVDHCEGYKAPKDDKMDEDTRQLHAEGCAPGSKFGSLPQLPKAGSNGGLDQGPNLPPMASLLKIKTEREDTSYKSQEKKTKNRKEKKANDAVKKIFKKKRDKDSSSSSSSSSDDSSSESDDANSRRKKKIKSKKHRKSSSCSDDSDDSSSKTKKRKVKDRLKSKDESASDENSGNEMRKLSKSHRQYQKQSLSDSENTAVIGKQHDIITETRPTKFKSTDKLSYLESSRTDSKAVTVNSRGDAYHDDKMYSKEAHGYHKSQKDFDKGRWSDKGREENWRYENGRKRDDRNYERERKVEKGSDGYRKFDGEKRYRDERRTNRREDQYSNHSNKRS